MTIEEAQIRLSQAEKQCKKEQLELPDGEQSESIGRLISLICFLKGYIQGYGDATGKDYTSLPT